MVKGIAAGTFVACGNYFAANTEQVKNKLQKAVTGLILFLLAGVSYGQTAPTLGTAANFVLFTTNGAMTCSGTKYLTHLTGNVGSDLPGSVTGFGNVDGVMHTADGTTGLVTPNVVSLYTQLSTAIPTATLASPFGGGATLFHGVYFLSGASTLTGNLILDAQGNPNAVFIFQINGVLSTNASSKIKLINGALACNVFWQVGGAVIVGTGTTMRGTIVANGQIDMTSTLDTLEGRALSINAAVLVSQLVAWTPIGCGSPLLTGPAAPAMLDSTAAYGVFSSIGAVTSTPITYVIGNVGGNSTMPTGFNPLNVTGTIHGMDISTANAAADLTNVYNYLVALPADIMLLNPPDFGHDLVLTPHSYQITGITQLTGNLYLNAEGDPNAVFVIKINGSLTTGTLSNIVLINGAQAKNVYWKVDGAVDIYSNSVFNGTLVVAGAISLETGDTLNGRALTINGAIAINGSYVKITPNACTAPLPGGIKHTCVGSTSMLTDSTPGGKWTSSDTAIAAVDSNSGMITGKFPGNAIITYTTLLGCTNSITFTVNGLPVAITGPGSVCQGDSITLVDSTGGGTWSSSNALIATVGSASGHVIGILPGTDTITYTMSIGCTATKTITVNATTNSGIIAGPSNVCAGSQITMTDGVSGGVWSASNTNATIGTTGIVTGVTSGIDTISYTVSGICGTATATKIITIGILTSAGTITGPSTVCVASQITLSDATTGGTWSSSNTIATVGSTGVVTGITPGVDTISYTVPGGCGTAIATSVITVNPLPNAGSITGASSVCIGSQIAMSEGVSGGIWSVSNGNATIGTSGIVTGVTSGIDTITYTVSNTCGTASATKIITIGSLTSAGTISGPSTVCVASQINLSDATTGGTWSSSNTSATVGSTGVVTGITPGVDTISYTVTGGCGTAIATSVITINPLPNAGSISGASSVCVGSSITLSDGITGGIWSRSNTNATVGLTGVVTGILAGLDTIMYSVANICGSATTSKIINVNSLTNAGVITGASNVCVGSSITLSDGISGGTWSSSNTNATVSGDLVTGVSGGSVIVSYTVTGICGSATAVHPVIITSLPYAGTITGLTSVCAGSVITLTDGISGGVWSSSNTTASIGTSGAVTGITAGNDTLIYTYTNTCGSAVTTYPIVINPLPTAGVISGSTSVCVGSSITYTDGVAGGSWSSSDITLATAGIVSGTVTGVGAGLPVISYAVSNMCGTATAIQTITVNPLPYSGNIIGFSSVCVGSFITLTDLTTGGTWSSSNANATVGTAGVVAGVSAGTVVISYSVTNMCGTISTTKNIVINPLPDAGVITGASSVCVGSSITLSDASAGGIWGSNNGTATVTAGLVAGVIPGTDTISYTVTNMCGTTGTTKIVLVNPLPYAGAISGPSEVCAGLSISLTDITAGGTWTSGNAAATVGTTGIVTGLSAGTAIISYTVVNTCGTDRATKTIIVNPLPAIPVVTTQAPSNACLGTMYQNYGTSNSPQALTTYKWTAVNAIVWAQGTAHQYSLINFTEAGNAYITLNSTFTATGCTNKSIVMTVNVSTSNAQVDVVSYFNNHFVCTPANNDTYQWGYDDANTLDSTLLVGEINQDYINVNPDFANKHYWSLTTSGGCLQKTYFYIPTGVQNVNNVAGITVYPNPASSIINVTIGSSVLGKTQIEVLNMIGQKITSVEANDNKATIDVAGIPAGSYLVICYNNGIKVATTRFIKN